MVRKEEEEEEKKNRAIGRNRSLCRPQPRNQPTREEDGVEAMKIENNEEQVRRQRG